jgi:hypothetical protein
MMVAKQRRQVRSVTIMGQRVLGAEEAAALRLEISRSFRASQERDEQIRALARRPDKGDAASVRFAMQCVEQRLVRGLWVLEISQESDGPREAKRHGMQYMRDHEDPDYRYEDAPAGKWGSPAPRPALPSSEEIDAAREAQGWLSLLEPGLARLLAVAALSKRGDRKSRVHWEKVKDRLRIKHDTPLRTLRDRYDQALRYIVAELTMARVG